MVTFSKITATLPVTDVTRAKDFYENKLGFKKSGMATPPDGVLYEAADGSYLYIYQRPPVHTEHTQVSLMVENLEMAVDELVAKGVTFEHYDTPALKTDAKGIFVMGNAKSAWCKDPDGNILSILEMS